MQPTIDISTLVQQLERNRSWMQEATGSFQA